MQCAAPPAAPHVELVGATHNTLKVKWTLGKGTAANVESEVEMQLEGHVAFKRMYLGPARSYKASKLAPETVYVFRVRNVGEAGAGNFSCPAKFQTLPAPLSAMVPPEVAMLGEDNARLTWPLASSADQHFELQLRCASTQAKGIDKPVLANGHPQQLSAQFVCVQQGSEHQCNLSGLQAGVIYEARLRLRQEAQGKTVLGLFSPPATIHVAAAPTTATETSATNHASRAAAVQAPQFSQRQMAMALAVVTAAICLALSLGLLR